MSFSLVKKITIVALAVAVLALTAVACRQGPRVDERQEDPEKYVRLALHNMYQSLHFSENSNDWLFDILNGRHEIELGFSLKDIAIPLPVDRQTLAMAQLARFDMVFVRDTHTKQMQADLNLTVGGAPALNVDLYMAEDDFAFRVPQGFDYFITLNPHQAASDLASSTIGDFVAGTQIMLGDFMDHAIYEIYSQLFSTSLTPQKLKIVNDTVKLFENAEYEFTSETDGIYAYSLLLKLDDFNEWCGSLVQSIANYEPFEQIGLDISAFHNFTVTGDIHIELQIKEDFVEFAAVNFPLANGVTCEGMFLIDGDANPFDNFEMTLRLENPNSTNAGGSTSNFDIAGAMKQYIMIDEMPPLVHIELRHTGDSSNSEIAKSEGSLTMWSGQWSPERDHTTASWNYLWDKTGDTLDNFKLSADITVQTNREEGGVGFHIAGTVMEDPEKKELSTHFSDISLHFSNFDEDEMAIAMTMKLNLRSALNADISYNRATAVRITELSPMQLLAIIAKFSEDPIIGGLLDLH